MTSAVVAPAKSAFSLWSLRLVQQRQRQQKQQKQKGRGLNMPQKQGANASVLSSCTSSGGHSSSSSGTRSRSISGSTSRPFSSSFREHATFATAHLRAEGCQVSNARCRPCSSWMSLPRHRHCLTAAQLPSQDFPFKRLTLSGGSPAPSPVFLSSRRRLPSSSASAPSSSSSSPSPSSASYTTSEESAQEEAREEVGLVTASLAEFLGTFSVIFVVTGAVVTATRSYTAALPDTSLVTTLALSASAAVACAVGATGGISGAHLNPAVTLGFLAVGRIAFGKAIAYVVAQVLGGIVGVGLVKAITPSSCQTTYGLHALAAGVTPLQGVLAESIFTGILMFVIYGSAIDPRGPKAFAPVYIALAVAAILFFGIGITGASMNPARSLAPALWTGMWTHHWVYWVGPMVGSTTMAVFYEHVMLTKKGGCN